MQTLPQWLQAAVQEQIVTSLQAHELALLQTQIPAGEESIVAPPHLQQAVQDLFLWGSIPANTLPL